MLRVVFCFLLNSITVLAHAQTVTTTITISAPESNKILSILSDMLNREGTLSNLKGSNAHLSTFIESADYGPMWYGDTIKVNQSGYLIQFEYERVDYINNKTSKRQTSESIYIPNDKSAIYEMYTCQFRGAPPSFGYANRRKEWDKKHKRILSILNNERR